MEMSKSQEKLARIMHQQGMTKSTIIYAILKIETEGQIQQAISFLTSKKHTETEFLYQLDRIATNSQRKNRGGTQKHS